MRNLQKKIVMYAHKREITLMFKALSNIFSET